MKAQNRLESLPNIGTTLAERLRSVGVSTVKQLEELGAVEAYKRIQNQIPEKLPVCYNLYSLEGALQNIDWRKLSEKQKNKLLLEAGRI